MRFVHQLTKKALMAAMHTVKYAYGQPGVLEREVVEGMGMLHIAAGEEPCGAG